MLTVMESFLISDAKVECDYATEKSRFSVATQKTKDIFAGSP